MNFITTSTIITVIVGVCMCVFCVLRISVYLEI